ncbi:hypothetical protein ERN12_00305 [Rhodobacteraceae bacterium]|nr:hypothetical protein ERN12_00305 [Paracoccaceae bacterium]
MRDTHAGRVICADGMTTSAPMRQSASPATSARVKTVINALHSIPPLARGLDADPDRRAIKAYDCTRLALCKRAGLIAPHPNAPILR